jgi:hypothetical protein
VEAEGAKVKATLCQQVVCVVAMMKGSRGVGEGEKVLGYKDVVYFTSTVVCR